MKTLRAADLFCGAGGTSTGMAQACAEAGVALTLTAVNHWAVAVATHSANHPGAHHLCAALDSLNPRESVPGGKLDMLWASPECTHHSIARGGKPINDQSRATAWCVVRWAEVLSPKVIFVENVPEFLTWGGICENGRPLQAKRGATFLAWTKALESLGYRVDWRVLCAADYGDPTTRKRLIVQCVRGRRKIQWPAPTHRQHASTPDLFAALQPWRTAREIIDWSLPGTSIYERERPLSDKTLRRIMEGLKRFGLGQFIVPHFGERAGQAPRGRGVDAPMPTVTGQGAGSLIEPFLVQLRGSTDSQIKSNVHPVSEPVGGITASGNHHGLCEPFIVRVAHGDSGGKRSHSVDQPLTTVTGINDAALCSPFLIQCAQGTKGMRSVDRPMPTVVASNPEWCLCEPALLPQQSDGRLRPVSEPVPTVATAGAIGVVEPFLVKFYGTGGAQTLASPLDTVTTRDRFGLARPVLSIEGQAYQLDVRFRMLQPHELSRAQGFPDDYQFTGTKTERIRQIGNAVPVNLSRALVRCALTSL